MDQKKAEIMKNKITISVILTLCICLSIAFFGSSYLRIVAGVFGVIVSTFIIVWAGTKLIIGEYKWN